MQDCTETQCAPVDLCVPQIRGWGGPLWVLHHMAQRQVLHGYCQLPLRPDEVVLETVGGPGIQGDVVKDFDGTL